MDKDNKYTPATIGELTFNIPLYQRMFRWGEEQIEQLLSDLYREYISGKKSGKFNPYYIGMITVHKNQNGDYDLIDGQQRFTVLMLIAIAFKGAEWKSFIQIGTKPRLSFFARPNSTSFIQKFIDSDSLEESLKEVESNDNQAMANGIKTICNFIKTKVASVEVEEFSTYIYRYVTFFISKLPEKYTATELNEYFETMNSSGKGLEKQDILKVDLLKGRRMDKSLYIKLWNLVSKMETRIHAHWIHESSEEYDVDSDIRVMKEQIVKLKYILDNSTYDDVSEVLDVFINKSSDEMSSGKSLLMIEAKEHKLDSEERSNERSIIKFPELLLFTLKMHSNEYNDPDFYNISFLLDRFIPLTGGKRMVDGETKLFAPVSDDEIKRFYVELLYYRLLVDFFIVRVKGKNEERKYQTLFTNSVYKGSEVEDQCAKRLVMYQAMLSVSTSWYIWLTPIIKWLDSNLNTDYQTYLKKIKEEDNNRHPEIPSSLRYDDCKERYWYWRLDYYLWERYVLDKENITELDRKIDKVYRTYVFRSNRSIEHFHPQNEDNYDDKWGDSVNVFGNLALISSEFNSTQSNDNFADKMSRIENRMNAGITESLKLVEMFKLAKLESNWSYEMASKHEEKMIAILKDSYM